MKDFFISYTSADRAWADWIAGELEDAGYETVHQSWDFRPGANFVSEMKKAAEWRKTIAVYSPNYFNSGFSEDEWTAAFADRSLIPARVRPCEIPALLRPVVYVDLLNLDADSSARAALLDGVRDGEHPRGRQPFPPAAAKQRPRFPGELPDVWEVPLPRNRNFTGRDDLLNNLHAALGSGRAAALTQAIAGLGGVGKTQLALEYCYRYPGEYDAVWWMRAEEPATLAADYARLASRLNLPERNLASQPEVIAAVRAWLERTLAPLAAHLRQRRAANPARSCAEYLPRSHAGHILFTSRHQAWRSVAEPLAVHKLTRQESIAFLQQRTGRDEPDAAGKLSDTLDGLALALSHAGAYIDANGISIAEYLALWRDYSPELLGETSATWTLSIRKLEVENSAALDLLRLIAFLAPDKIPRDLLQSRSADLLAFHKSVEGLLRYSLVEATPEAISAHRLVQESTRKLLDEEGRRRYAEAAVKLVGKAFPSPADHRNWPACSKLLAHALEAAEFAEDLAVGLEAASRALNETGLYEQYQAQLSSAEKLLRRALEIGERVYGPDHNEVAIRASNLGSILKDQGDLAGAIQLTRRALEIDEKVHGHGHPNVARDANNVGQILKAECDLTGAMQFTRRAHGDRSKGLRPRPPHRRHSREQLGLDPQRARRSGRRRPIHPRRRALEIAEKVYGPDHPAVAIYANNLGQIVRAQGDLAGAPQFARRALEIDEKVYGPDHPAVARDANSLGQILEDQDRSGQPSNSPGAL